MNFQVVAAMAMVRNSVGSDGYVSDEIITSRLKVTNQVEISRDLREGFK